ncbi:arginase [Propionicimonas sp.]|uniref:arginase n=1 Tax=Propionicimonas sp. TaxID=1955623 RepID=UPI001793782A|nr:arginase [Propionicimonas sp.]MBU3977415.1 arginase [Actinomycetota bacterium]MBA3021339.1 arginase [Propionicimonas sp.]MBU3985925.1 arginase [Actinomycetota bacterium]MBU4008710.1 arginase [Actinomycetota bacterium]MBU4066140.1 arginase [Actinomycetota bacterium]
MLQQVSLIGAPTDVGASRLGCRLGPQALRVAGLGPALAAFGCDVRDVGDLSGPQNPELPPVGGYRHLDEVTAWNRAVFDATAAELAAGRLPILLGGDHSLAIGSISAVAAHCRATGKTLRVLWIDAHADFNTAELTPSGNIHGMPVACLAGHGPAGLTGLSGTTPALSTDAVRQVGLRSVDVGEKSFLRAEGVEVFDMRFIDEIGMRRTMVRALAGVDADTHLHLSLDLDFVDPLVAPGVGTPVRGGATYREVQLCMEMIADTGRLGSIDLVEVNPALDEHNATAELTVDLAESLFGKSTLERVHPDSE